MAIQKDRYYCLNRRDTTTLTELFGIGSSTACVQAPNRTPMDKPPGDTESLALSLLQLKILVTGTCEGSRSCLQSDIPTTDVSLLERPSDCRSIHKWRHIWRFCRAAALASCQLRKPGLADTVSMVKRAKSRTPSLPGSGAVEVDELFKTFQLLRPYYPRPYLCLFDSLALVHFLCRFGVCPDWVFGVKIAPFGAHCWVQVGNVLVNDLLDNVRSYVPIMRV